MNLRQVSDFSPFGRSFLYVCPPLLLITPSFLYSASLSLPTFLSLSVYIYIVSVSLSFSFSVSFSLSSEKGSMGSSGSRLGSRRSLPQRANTHRTTKRIVSSLFLCGASSSRASIEMDDDPAEFLVNSAEHSHLAVDKFQCSTKEPALTSGTGSECKPTSGTRSCRTMHNTENGGSSKCSMVASEVSTSEDGSGNVETSNEMECLSKRRELSPHELSTDHGSNYAASASYGDQLASDLAFANGSTSINIINDMRNTINRDVPQNCAGVSSANSLSLCGLGDSTSDGISVGNNVNEVSANHHSNSTSASVVTDSPLSLSLRENSIQEASPSGLGFLVSEREQGWRDASVLHVDVVSISSDILSSNTTDISNREARRNGRRLFWDAFSRRSSRRNSESQNIVFSTEDSDDLGSHDRWLLDFSGDFFNDGFESDFGNMRRSHSIERRWHSRSEIRERIHGGIVGTARQTGVCPSGLHPEGNCSCASVLMAEEPGTRASISRIVMLAEALFEVLDEIHRQPVSLSLSMVSLPAPESVVDSFPVKSHRKPKTPEDANDVARCYICLAEYEELDEIRVLPCNHEFHMTCVDKWLKEIHGVCPLCRGDVRQGLSESSVSNSEIPSL